MLHRLIVVVLIVVSPSVFAVDRVMEYLMNEPASLMDFGLFKVQKEMDEINYGDESRFTYVAYPKIDGQKITLKVDYLYGFDGVSTAKSACKRVVEDIRRQFGVFNVKGKLRQVPEVGLSSYFEHSGYTRSNRPDDLQDTVNKMAEIVFEAAIPGAEKKFICKGSLVGSEVYTSD